MLGSILQHTATRDIQLDGARIPVLHPNTKLNLQQLGQPSGTGSEYEQSLLRHIAAGLGVSYEQFSRDYTKTNYSSARASMNETSSLCNRAKRPSPINSQRKSTAYGWKSKLTTVLSHCRRVKQPRGFMRIQNLRTTSRR